MCARELTNSAASESRGWQRMRPGREESLPPLAADRDHTRQLPQLDDALDRNELIHDLCYNLYVILAVLYHA